MINTFNNNFNNKFGYGYNYFYEDNYKMLKKNGLIHEEIMVHIRQKWKSLSSKEQAEYLANAVLIKRGINEDGIYYEHDDDQNDRDPNLNNKRRIIINNSSNDSLFDNKKARSNVSLRPKELFKKINKVIETYDFNNKVGFLDGTKKKEEYLPCIKINLIEEDNTEFVKVMMK